LDNVLTNYGVNLA